MKIGSVSSEKPYSANGKIIATVAILALCRAAFASATTVWTGAAGDGKWSTPGNWEGGVVPVSGNDDTVSLNGANGADMENDIDNLTVARICFSGTDQVRLTGKELTIGTSTSEIYVWTNSCPVICEAPIKVKTNVAPDNRYVVFYKDVHFYAPISTTGTAKQLRIHSRPNSGASAYFHAPVTGGRIYLEPSVSSFHFYEGFTTTVFTASSSYGDAGSNWAYFYKPIKNGNYFQIAFRKFGCKAANILDPDAELRWSGYRSNGVMDLLGFDQTVNCLGGTYEYRSSTAITYPDNNGRVLTSTAPATLTMRATMSCETPVIVKGAVTLKYAPTNSNYVQTFSYRTNTTTGAILVMDGTVKIAHMAKFTKVPMIYVGPTATLEIDADNGIANPFPDLRTLEVAAGGKVKLPVGVALTAARVVYGTERMPDGVPCTSATGWIEGDGTVTPSAASLPSSPTEWLSLSGDWNAAANWSAGVPSLTLPSSIYGLYGQDVTVSVSSDAAQSTNLMVRAEAGTAKLNVNALLPFTNAWISLGKGAVVEVGNGGHFEYTGTPSTGTDKQNRMAVSNDASIVIRNGGRMSFTDVPGFATFGDGNEDSSVSLTIDDGGEFSFLQGLNSACLFFNRGSTLDIRGRFELERRFGNNSSRYFNLNGGSLAVSGNGLFDVKKGRDGTTGGNVAFIGGNVSFSDNAQLRHVSDGNWNSYLYFGSIDWTHPLNVTFADNACVSGFVGHVCVYGNSVLDMSSVKNHGFLSRSASCYDLTVGARNGDSKFYYGGEYFYISLYGLYVGNTSSTTDNRGGSGEMVMMDGAVITNAASAAISRSSAGVTRLKKFYGTVIGVWLNASNTIQPTQRPLKGVLRMRGPATRLVTTAGHFVAGAGCAEGLYVQEDGTNYVVASSYSANNDGVSIHTTNNVMAVGMLGGRGECIVSNGYFKSNIRTFVGGCHTNEYFDGAHFDYGTSKCTANYRNAEGFLRIAGGRFECTRSMYVGSDGEGTVEIGPSGLMSVAHTLVLSNQTASTLKFKFGPDGVGSASVGKLVITPGARLEVDASAYEGLRSHFSILDAGSVEGAFGEQDIDVCGDVAGRPAMLVTLPEGKGYRVVIARGTRIMLR